MSEGLSASSVRKDSAKRHFPVSVQLVYPRIPRRRRPRGHKQALPPAPRSPGAGNAPRLRRSLCRSLRRSSLCSWSSRRRTLCFRRQVAELSERLAKQEERIAELERRLKRNSRNPSLPPSQDPPAAPERRQAAPSGRGRGAQPGHPGRGRHLAPITALDEFVEHWPE